METYEIYYDYCHEDGEVERNCIDIVECSWEQLQDILREMRQSDAYMNIAATCITEERW